jgi:predicted ArsR family transcriptional regulator
MSSPWRAVAALVDQVRRALYDYVRRQDHPVSREEAADAHRISRSLAAFHLDKLVDVGLLNARYQAPPGVQRGRGRTPKVYAATDADLSLSIPERRYALMGEILADAVAEAPTDAGEAGLRHARLRGQELGEALRAADGGPRESSAGEELRYLCRTLADLGFDPLLRNGSVVRLGNCPFRALAQRQPALICGLNLAFIRGLLDGIGASRFTTLLAPLPGQCCVQVQPALS